MQNHSAHGYYDNPHRGRGKVFMILLHVKKNQTKLRKNCCPYNTITGSVYISNEGNLSDGTSKINVSMYI